MKASEVSVFQKIADIMCWPIPDGANPYDTYLANFGNIPLPSDEIIDVVWYGGFKELILSKNFESQNEIKEYLMDLMNKILSCTYFDNKEKNIIKKLNNLYLAVTNLDRRLKQGKFCDELAEQVWHSYFVDKIRKAKLDDMLKFNPSKEAYDSAAERIKDIWGFNDTDIDAFRYFVCQSKKELPSPSQNKSLYLWGKSKKTGKTTLAKTIAAILNGDTIDNGGKYQSEFGREMQFGTHDLPAACMYNCVYMDEALPKDSKKSYGTIKNKLTSDFASFDPKFQSVITMKARRNYIFTSNDSIVDFIQDESERRFYAINMEKPPKQISFEEIEKVWKEFIYNATPESDTQKWYDSFAYISGDFDKKKTEMLFEIIHDDFVKSLDASYTLTLKKILNILRKNEPTKEDRTIAESVMDTYFNNVYSDKKCYQILNSKFKERIIEIRKDVGFVSIMNLTDDAFDANSQNLEVPF